MKRDKLDERYGLAEHAGFDPPRWATTVQESYGRDVEPGSPANDLPGRLLWRSLAHKGPRPLQAGGELPDSFDFGIVRGNACRRISEVQACEQARPQAGTPYALPGPAPRELSVIRCWLHAGAQHEAAALRPADAAAQAMAWDGLEASNVALSGEVRLSDEPSKIEQLIIDKMKVELAYLRRRIYRRSTPGSNRLIEIQCLVA